ncbi:acyltransferase [Actinorhabdospora filicis]|uniref:Acyltransferase n=1 Tax=Actinorhabdospora filicis TaxID=1785913 RepID=A0A9W6W8B8_9ACTN|nr:acyltransferase [Actinorhabdospora filicis]GLZ77434.1 acyltransferase [Actinorhabdospora filicis]
MKGRDGYLDLLRGFSLAIVVASHLAFTVLKWHEDGPHTSSPMEFVPGLWIITWVLQVMPLFFYIGGYGHARSLERGGHPVTWVLKRLAGLLVPALALVAVWVVAGCLLASGNDGETVYRVVKLVLSPLWFLGIYAGLIVAAPLARRLHRRFGLWAPGAFILGAVIADVIRFRFDLENAGYANYAFVWLAAHQAGFSHERLRELGRGAALAVAGGGLGTLALLVGVLGYPGAMVGVPGMKYSNMNPPTVAILGLLTVQIGLMALLRPAAERWLAKPGPARMLGVANKYGLPVFLLHTTGAAVFSYAAYRVLGTAFTAETSDASWWATRPVVLVGSLACTVLLIAALSRARGRGRGRGRSSIRSS